jgi:membrane protein
VKITRFKEAIDLLVETYRSWDRHNAQTMGASLAYFTVLSLAPLLIIAVAIAGLVFGRQAAQGMVVTEIDNLVGTAGAQVIQDILVSAHSSATGIFASALGFGTLLFGATGVFNELRSALNRIWDVPPSPFHWRSVLSEQLRSFSLVVGVGFLILILLILNTVLSSIGGLWASLWIANTLGSLAVIVVLFALLYRLVPATRIPWSDVWIGAAASAVLFTLGKHLLGAYFGRASIGSAYGAAGSLVVLLAWIYYSAQIFLFGAEFTHTYAVRNGSRRPSHPLSYA